MADFAFVADIDHAQFESRVLAASAQLPVLVDFWAPWCGPCRVLTPVLTKLAEEYQGRFFLAKINTDNEPELAGQYGIRGIPAVKLFRHGQVVEEFVGVQPEPTIRARLDRHIPRESDALVAHALELARVGRLADAEAELRRAIARDPKHDPPKIELARLLLASAGDAGADRLSEARELLGALSIRTGTSPQVEALRARLDLLELTAGTPPLEHLERAVATNPDDHAARHLLGIRLALADKYEAALEQLLELVRRDRRYGDEAGRKAMLATFQLLGSRDPLVIKYRTLLARTLN